MFFCLRMCRSLVLSAVLWLHCLRRKSPNPNQSPPLHKNMSDLCIQQALHLYDKGYVLIPLSKKRTKEARRMFAQYVDSIPEHKSNSALALDKDIGAGSFGAINYASAYHCPVAVHVDLMMIDMVKPILLVLANLLGLGYWELIPDRLCYRTNKQLKESYHRDNSAGASSSSDIFLGGFANLSPKGVNQQFTLLPGTHTPGASLKAGDFTPENVPDEVKARAETVIIPPNSAIVVFENILHCVSGPKPASALLRKFFGFRLSNDTQQWFPENIPRMQTQSALAHKGGTVAPLIPKLWRTNWPDKCEAYCTKLKPLLVTTYTYMSGKKKGRTINIPHLLPPSLEQLDEKYLLTDEAKNRFRLRRVNPLECS